MQECEPLSHKLRILATDSGGVAAWPVELGDQANRRRVGADVEDDWNGSGRRLGCERRWGAARRSDHRHPPAYQISRQFWQPIVLPSCPAVLNPQVLAFEVAGFA